MNLGREYQGGGLSAGKKRGWHHRLRHHVVAGTKIERGHSRNHPVLSQAPDSISLRPFLSV